MLKRFVSIVGLIALAACQSAPPAPQYPEPTWRHLPQYGLAVRQVEVVTQYKPPLKAPNVEHLFPHPPAKAVTRWSNDRLSARGGTSTARVIISNASVVEHALKKDSSVSGVFTNEQSEKYDGRLEVTVEIRSDRGFREAFVHAAAKRTRTVPEDVSVNEREKVWYEMTEAMMKDINAQLEQAIPQYFQRWLR